MAIFNKPRPSWSSTEKALRRHVRERVIRQISDLDKEFPNNSFWHYEEITLESEPRPSYQASDGKTNLFIAKMARIVYPERIYQHRDMMQETCVRISYSRENWRDYVLRRERAFRQCAITILTSALQDAIDETATLESTIKLHISQLMFNLHLTKKKAPRATLPLWVRHPELMSKDLNEDTLDTIRELNKSSLQTRWKRDIPLSERVSILQDTLMRNRSNRVKRLFEDGRVQAALCSVLTIDGMMATRKNLKKILANLTPPDDSIWWVTNEYWVYMGRTLYDLFEECEKLSVPDGQREES
ncbi:hypothetical protein GGR57DRAFT_498699 [Xylariaceae sp. FL1272]|nr:hypothetical protein GGR57DRAFT_498699 [Xylariaceae sp. FL1272]